MSRCVIIGAGSYEAPTVLSGYLQADDYVIAADGGWQLAQLMGITPAVLVADFDSMSMPVLNDAVKVVSLPIEKDETDTAYALKLAYEDGYREFLLLGCTGGRLDHWQAALTIAAEYARRGCEVVLADEHNEIHLLSPGAYAFPVSGDEKISLFAFGGEVTGLFADGLYYDVTDMTLTPFDPLCVSNFANEDDFQLVFKSGILMLYFSKD